MRDGGRLAAAIDVLGDIAARHRPARLALKAWGEGARYAGAKDRAFVSGLLLDVLRRRRSLAWMMGDEGDRAAVLAAVRFAWDWPAERVAAAAGEDHGPGPLTAEEGARLAAPIALADAPDAVRGDWPDWLTPHMTRAFGAEAPAEGGALAQRAPVDLRVNTLKTDTARALKALAPFGAAPAGTLATAIRIAAPAASERAAPVEAAPEFAKGWFEVQDLASQIAAACAGEIAHRQVLDFCAGGGGKTLALAAAMANTGQLFAHDADARRLAETARRAQRAGVRNLQVRSPIHPDPLAGLEGRMDLVFVDAPCTGSGVWRRHPDAKWRVSSDQLARRMAEQDAVLAAAAAFVKPGGRLVYVTCSLFAEENEDRIAAFLARNGAFTPEPVVGVADAHVTAKGFLRLTPLAAGTDGFFVAALRRASPRPMTSRRFSANQPAMPQPVHAKVLIVDFGSQVTQLIARRVRESGVYCEIHPFDRVAPMLESFSPAAVILSGGPATAGLADSPTAPAAVFDLGVPVLGICYGEMTLCAQLGGKVEGGREREFGRAQIIIERTSPLLDGLADVGESETVWMSHGDKITAIPPGFEVVATSPGSPFAAIADEARGFYGVQFHPEVVHTPHGAAILRNFTHRIAGLSGDWTMAAFRAEAVAAIRKRVGGEKVILGLSGGVDSSVAAVLIHEAIGEQLTCVFVDTGLMRRGEADEVVGLFRDHYNIPLIHVDASKEFLDALAGVSDPEAKRKIIGGKFIDVFDREAGRIEGAAFLAQGTLYPDVIESVSVSGGPSAVIKSHHNVGGLPERMKLKLLEPLRELFKDEVRTLGAELGLPAAFVGRHPFPGPGLAIRIPGEITPEAVAALQHADAVWLDEIRKAGLYDLIWQAFAVLLPVKTVGVMGDARTYENVLALRAVTSTDGMTADVFEFSWDVLTAAATRIVNEVRGVNRVVYDVTSKPPGTIEWE